LPPDEVFVTRGSPRPGRLTTEQNKPLSRGKETIMKTPSSTLRRLRTGLLAAASVAMVAGATLAPALADEGRHGDWRAHGWHGPDRYAPRPWLYAAPGPYPVPVYGYGYAYAPPPVVYPAPALNFGVTIR
jgi:hypothetical protein